MKKIFTIVFIILGAITGCGLGDMCSGIESLKCLAIGREIEFKNSLLLDLFFLQLTFGIWCKINLAGILSLILAAFMSSNVIKWLKI